jgi:squalene-hopene/tetraprenyl-beta-curcumene cyclase
MLAYLERDESELAEQCAATIRYEQRPDGGWSTTPDGVTDLGASVQAYFALKLTGHDPTDDLMRQARERIRALGGVDAADADTRYLLALFGQVNYDVCEPMPPEAFLFGQQRSQLQTTKAILWSHRPVHSIEIGRGVRELFVERPAERPAGRSLTRRFSTLAERRRWTPLRRRALNRIEQQLLEHVERADSAYRTCQDLIHQLVALRTLGYDVDGAEISQCDEALRDLVEVDETTGRVYPRLSASAASDSALVLRSLVESGMSPLHPAVQEGRDFVSNIAATKAPLSGEDVANVIAGLRDCESQGSDSEASLPPDFDVCCDWDDSEFSDEFRSDVSDPSAQVKIDCFIARLKLLQGSSQPHIAGAAVESLAATGDADVQTAIKRCSRDLKLAQRADGSWSDSDGTNQIISTSSAIRGLLAAGLSADDDRIAAAANWLTVEQRPNGSWNDSTTETAWAALGLVAVGQANQPSVRRGIDYLLDEQDEAGGWADLRPLLQDPVSNHWFRNDLHSTAWTLVALSRFAVAASSAQSAADGEMSLRLVAASAEI